jgi:hypothetical protein
MRKDLIATPLPPFTSEEESALVERLGTMDAAALDHYVDSAERALGNSALEPSWRPRVEFGLKQAQAAIVKEAAASALAAAALVAAPVAPASTKVRAADA